MSRSSGYLVCPDCPAFPASGGLVLDLASTSARASKKSAAYALEPAAEGSVALADPFGSSSPIAEPSAYCLSLEDVPEAIIVSSLLPFLGPQSTLLRLSPTSKYLRSACESDCIWRQFIDKRCVSRIDYGPPEPVSWSRSESLWVKATRSLESGRRSPEEMLCSVYSRLHLLGREPQRCITADAITCNRSAGYLSQGLGDDPLEDEDGEGQHAHQDQPQNQGEAGDPALRVCGNPATICCENPHCNRARCGPCNSGSSPSSSDASVGQVIVRCSWCALRLCRGCLPGRMSYCDGCNRGVCLDCEEVLEGEVGPIRSCADAPDAPSCVGNVCLKCARSVGKAKRGREPPPSTSSLSSPPQSSTVTMTATSVATTPLSIRRRGGTFAAIAYGSEEQFRNSSPRQILCQICADNKVGKLNMYRRLSMSPRPTTT